MSACIAIRAAQIVASLGGVDSVSVEGWSDRVTLTTTDGVRFRFMATMAGKPLRSVRAGTRVRDSFIADVDGVEVEVVHEHAALNLVGGAL